MPRLSRFAVAVIASAAIAIILTHGSYALGFWAGGHRGIRDYLLKSLVMLPILIGLLAATWPSRRLKRSPLVAGMVGAVIGLTYSYLATRVMFWLAFKRWGGFGHSVFLYPIGWDQDIEAAACGIVIGAGAMLLAIAPRSPTVLSAILILLLIGVFAPSIAFNLITQNQELTVAVVTPRNTPSASQVLPEVNSMLRVRPIDVRSMTSRVQQLLRNSGIAGNYGVVDLYRQGEGKQVLVIIVISEPVTQRTDLPEPRGTDVIYVQERGAWKTVPQQFPALDTSSVRTFFRTIIIWPPRPGDKSLGLVMIADATGVGSPFWIPSPAQ